jgi:mannose-6-phosphate isomerase-like protein (cupin superfamily)
MVLPQTTLYRVYYVVSGTGWFQLGKGESRGKKRALKAGRAISAPAGSSGLIFTSGKRSSLELLEISLPMQAESKGRSPAVSLSKQNSREYPVAGGKLRVHPLLRERLLGHKNLYLGTLKAAPGFLVKEHQHAGSAEVLFVLNGTGKMSVDGVQTDVVPRQAIYIPAGKKHHLVVGKGLTVVQAYVPAGPEMRFFGNGKSP